MRVFVLRARKGPTSPAAVGKTMGYPDHFEVIAHSIVSALLISKRTRDDVVFHAVLEGRPAPPVTATFDSSSMGPLGGFDEATIADLFRRILRPAATLGKEEQLEVEPGVRLRKISFEALVKGLSRKMPVYLLDRKGEDIRTAELVGDCAFIFTDHIPMQKKTLSLLRRLGVTGLSLGPRALFAAHCITLVHNALDRREAEAST
ncbi:MAG: tRNA (pseudouridine(54)-N(1))-methyltransferase TrmY [Spirochaetia bacterium]